MKRAALLLLAALPALAIDGVVINKTTGKPAVDATVSLYKLGSAGMEAMESVHTGAQGKFAIAKDVEGGPRLIQTAFDGVTYNHMLPPGAPTSGLTLEVYNCSKKPGGAQVSQHMILLEPGQGQLGVSEAYIYKNDGPTTYNDPEGGTFKFHLPAGVNTAIQVNATAPQGMPLPRQAEKSGKENVYKIDFPIKPGETRFDVSYTVPFTDGTFEDKILPQAGPTRLVTPSGVTLQGGNIQSLGPEPQSQANIYDVQGEAFKVAITGTGSMRPQQPAEAQDAGPQLEQIMPKVWDNVALILGLALGILALGFALLYRAQPAAPAAEGQHVERRRR